MDPEFVFLAVVSCVTLVLVALVVPVALQVFSQPVEDSDDVWAVCEKPLSNADVRDCVLRRALVDANLLEAG